MFDIQSTNSFNADKLVCGNEYDYVTRTAFNQGILQTTGFINTDNINEAGVWSLGLMQMTFFYRQKKWYAGQFVRKIIPRFKLEHGTILYFSVVLNKLRDKLLPVLVRNIDTEFRESVVKLPVTSTGEIDFDFMNDFIAELEAERTAELEAYLQVTGLSDYVLTDEEEKALEDYKNGRVKCQHFTFCNLFNHIKQGRRLKTDDQIKGNIPFVMSGTTNTGVVGYISNPVASFPKNAITIDIFGNAFYRDYAFGAGDDTGVYWNDIIEYSRATMLYYTTAMGKALYGKYSYGKKLRSSQSFDFTAVIPTKNGQPDYSTMDVLISAVQKMVIKDVVKYADDKIKNTAQVIANNK